MFGRGFIFAVFQIYHPDSILVYAKMIAPARIFISKKDTIRWKLALDVEGICTRVEYRELPTPKKMDSIIHDSTLCVIKGEKRFHIYAEIMDNNSGKSLRKIVQNELKNKKDLLVSSLMYEYTPKGVNLKLNIVALRKKKVSVSFGFKNQWERWRYFDKMDLELYGDTMIEFTIPKRFLSFGEITFAAEIDGIKRETQTLFNEFNIENDRDFKVLLSVLDFVYGKKTDILKKAKREDRLKYWEKFWNSIGGNKVKEIFFERLYTAMQLYPSNIRNRVSDRAMVYTKFGPPDEIIYEPYRLEGKPYEIWYYYRLGLRFIFVDFDGTGDYRLVPEGYLDIIR